MAEISGRQAQHRPGLVLPGDPAFNHINPARQFQPQLSGRDYPNGIIRKQIIAEANYER